MPVYMLHGFRWPRAGFTGIRVYIVLHNLEDAAAEYIQQPLTTELLRESLRKTQPDILPRLPELRFIEQYDPNDESSNTVSQDYAYVAAKVMTIPDGATTADGLKPGKNIEDAVEQGPGLTSDQTEALEELRNRLAPDEKIGWFMVYNGDPERYFPEFEEDYDDENYVDDKSKLASDDRPQGYTRRSFKLCANFRSGKHRCRPGNLLVITMVLSFILVQNRQGKTRLAKWYAPYSDEEKVKLKGEVHRLVAPRDQKYQSNFVEFRRSAKIVYRRYAGLFFCVCVDANDNELAYLEAIHFFVEVLDQFFGNVCELDLVFNFYKVYAILDEVFLAGEIEETSKQVVLTRLEHLDKLE
ncbi:hypothetical protein N7495_002348 [Penicillium taxi]|uniref:uncharacterized protein n=1 Tax=Penicillium taxi TaxID=168475 RepID=UPI002545676C|nr:uncharacterized protein N7495_002348 [Penicillium taxi]KAJ5901820.1 hypothetical protein N7495_002348 [Penicillium taxi]